MRLEGTGGLHERPSRSKREYLLDSEPPARWLEREFPPGVRESKSGLTPLMFVGMSALGVVTLGAAAAPLLAAKAVEGAGAAAINQLGALGTNALSDVAAAGLGHQMAKRKYRGDASKFERHQVENIMIERDRYLFDKFDQSAQSTKPDFLLQFGWSNRHAEVKVVGKRPKDSTQPN